MHSAALHCIISRVKVMLASSLSRMSATHTQLHVASCKASGYKCIFLSILGAKSSACLIIRNTFIWTLFNLQKKKKESMMIRPCMMLHKQPVLPVRISSCNFTERALNPAPLYPTTDLARLPMQRGTGKKHLTCLPRTGELGFHCF